LLCFGFAGRRNSKSGALAFLAGRALQHCSSCRTCAGVGQWISYEKQKDGSSGRPNGALTMALNMHDALVYGDLNAWVYWSFQDGKQVSQYNLTANGDRTSKKLLVARHYFRYIRPGAVRIDALPTSPEHTLCAFVQDGQKTVSIILSNQTDQPEPMTLTLKNLGKVDAAKLVGFVTTAQENWKQLPALAPGGGTLKVELPAQSVMTLTSAGVAK
jgi:O-glycosyl hydrolase